MNHRLRLTDRRNIAIGFVGVVAILIVYIMGNHRLAGVVFWLLFAFVLFSLVILLLPQGRNLFTVIGPMQADKSADITFQMNIHHSFWSVGKKGTVVVIIENLLTGEVDKDVLPIGGSGGRDIEKTVTVKEDCCGCLRVRLEAVEWTGFFGVLCRQVPLDVEHRCLIIPRVSRIKEREDIWDAYDMESHRYSQISKGGDPGEVFSLRNYLPGDSLRQIHWKLSGKLSEVIVKELSLPVDNKLLILLDKDGRGLSQPEQRSKAAELFCSLSFTAMGKGIPHSVGWYDHVNHSFRVFSIKEENDFWEAIEELLQVGFWEEEESMVYRYFESEMEKQFRNIVVVSEEGKDLERLHSYGQIHIYRPGKDQ